MQSDFKIPNKTIHTLKKNYMSLYEGSVKKPIMTSLCFVAVAILGIFSLTKLPIDLYPDIETNTIMVMTA